MRLFLFVPVLLLVLINIAFDNTCLYGDKAYEVRNNFNESSKSEYASIFPFDKPSVSSLRKSKKKVFAHYFTQFPLSIDNKPSDDDYYTKQYLSTDGEKGKHKAYGGYLRTRPLPRKVKEGANWKEIDLKDEISMASNIGIDGFACNLLNFEGRHWEKAEMLFKVASEVDPNFKIMIMPDMNSNLGKNPDKIEEVVVALSKYKSAYRLNDGRLVVAPYNAQRKDANWWKTWLERMKKQGIDIAFVPVFQGWGGHAQNFGSISYGMSDWGIRSPNKQQAWREVPKKARLILKTSKISVDAYNSKKQEEPIWMMPVAPQDLRPRAYAFWETGNSNGLRVMWTNAIEGDADWVQLITWNDYAENTMISPSTGTQYGFYDLTAYYITWFKMGKKPDIVRDVLYYFYRKQSVSAKPNLKLQSREFKPARGSDEPKDEIELLGFLTEPARLEIIIGGKKYSKDFGAGLQSFRVPSKAGVPMFQLVRNGSTKISFKGAFEIVNEIDYQDLLYYSGSNTRSPVLRR